MQAFPHTYHVHLTGGPIGHGRLATPGVGGLDTAPPPEFGGPGDAWSPEHLLLAAVEACLLFTLRAVARASRLEFTTLEVACDGIVNRRDGVTRFIEIVLRPRIVVPAGTDPGLVGQVLLKSKRACLVSASLNTDVRLEEEVVVAAA